MSREIYIHYFFLILAVAYSKFTFTFCLAIEVVINYLQCKKSVMVPPSTIFTLYIMIANGCRNMVSEILQLFIE